MKATVAVLLLLLSLSHPAAAAAQRSGSDTLRNAKELYFDRKYAEARELWRALARSGAADASPRYWIAKCSEELGERERALTEYAEFLEGGSGEPLFVEQAKTSRVGIAARLYRSGQTRHLRIIEDAVRDSSRTVRYYAALQLGRLGPEVGRPAIPVLKEILAEEDDPDLVDRARLALVRLDPTALSKDEARDSGATSRQRSGVKWVRLQIQEDGESEPSVSLSLPVALAELVFKSLPEDAKREFEREGIDADNFWDRLHQMGPTSILEIEGEGSRIRLWLE
jgi:hypothetical protein